MVFVKFVLFVTALAAVSSSHPSEPRLVLDMILKGVLEGLKPKLKDLHIPKQAFELNEPGIRISASLDNGLVKHLNEFHIAKLTTKIVPLKLTNLTITLDHVELTGNYCLNASLTIPEFTGDARMYGNGSAQVDLYGLFFTIAADFVLKNGKFQIPENGLHGFDVNVAKSKFNLANLTGGGSTGNAVNDLISQVFPQHVQENKKEIRKYIMDRLRSVINSFLKRFGLPKLGYPPHLADCS